MLFVIVLLVTLYDFTIAQTDIYDKIEVETITVTRLCIKFI